MSEVHIECPLCHNGNLIYVGYLPDSHIDFYRCTNCEKEINKQDVTTRRDKQDSVESERNQA